MNLVCSECRHVQFMHVATCTNSWPTSTVSPPDNPTPPKLPQKRQVYITLHCTCIEFTPLSKGKFLMFGVISKCSFRNNSCISNKRSSEHSAMGAACLTIGGPYKCGVCHQGIKATDCFAFVFLFFYYKSLKSVASLKCVTSRPPCLKRFATLTRKSSALNGYMGNFNE